MLSWDLMKEFSLPVLRVPCINLSWFVEEYCVEQFLNFCEVKDLLLLKTFNDMNDFVTSTTNDLSFILIFHSKIIIEEYDTLVLSLMRGAYAMNEY